MPEEMTLGIDVETGQPITISDRDRCGGLYALGAPRVGKSTLFIWMALKDIERGHGLLFIDPHADAIAEILNRIPKRRLKDVMLLDPTDSDYAFGINPLYCANPHDLREQQLCFGQARDVFSKTFEKDEQLGIWLRKYLINCLYPLIENPGHTLYDMWLFLHNKPFRDALLNRVTSHREVVDFWHDEYDQMSRRDQAFERSSLLTRLNILNTHPYIKHVIGQATPTIDFVEVMEERKIVLLRIPSWQDAESRALIGILVISQLLKTIFLRAEVAEQSWPRPPLHQLGLKPTGFSGQKPDFLTTTRCSKYYMM
jgi:hypothetical protein